MTSLAIQSLILSGITSFGLAVLGIITAIIVISVAYLVFNFGYKTLFLGQTSLISSRIQFFDHAPFTKPYKGYNRLRSQSWNIKNTMN